MGNQKGTEQDFDADLFKKDLFTVDKTSFRPEKIARRIQDELLLMIPDELDNPKVKNLGSVTITQVKCAKDLRNATVGFALSEDLFFEGGTPVEKQKKAELYLNQAAGYIRHLLAERMGMKYTPIICFKYDRGTVHSQKIESILTKTIKK